MKVPKRIHVSKLQNLEVCDNIDVGTVAVLSIKDNTQRLVCENDAAITKFLNEKNRLHEKLLSTDSPGRIAAGSKFETTARISTYAKQVVVLDLGKNSASL